MPTLPHPTMVTLAPRRAAAPPMPTEGKQSSSTMETTAPLPPPPRPSVAGANGAAVGVSTGAEVAAVGAAAVAMAAVAIAGAVQGGRWSGMTCQAWGSGLAVCCAKEGGGGRG